MTILSAYLLYDNQVCSTDLDKREKMNFESVQYGCLIASKADVNETNKKRLTDWVDKISDMPEHIHLKSYKMTLISYNNVY